MNLHSTALTCHRCPCPWCAKATPRSTGHWEPALNAAILDWRPDATGEAGPPRSHRLSTGQVRDHLEAAIFTTVTVGLQDDDSYLVQAR
jgi:hypothetical protein